MGSILILEDGSGWAAAEWAFRALLRAIGEDLRATDENDEFAQWLLSRAEEPGMGLRGFDVRGLTRANQLKLAGQIPRTYERLATSGPASWSTPQGFPAWLARVERLVELHRRVQEKKPTQDISDLKEKISFDGRQIGPGW